jgi:hypothetical protein
MRTVTAAAVAALLTASPATALASGAPTGVHVDPGSPAGKQYSIPIAAARQQANPSQSSGSSGSAPPLFGAGVTPSSSLSSTSSGATHGSQARSTRAGSASHATRSRGQTRAGYRRTRIAASAAPAQINVLTVSDQAGRIGASTWLPLGIGGALVLVIGAGGGLMARRLH